MTNKYELVFLLDAQTPQEKKEAACKQVTEAVAKHEGKIINSNVWLERQKMTFPLKRCLEATYYLMNLEANSAAINKIRQTLRLNEDLLRFLVVRVE